MYYVKYINMIAAESQAIARRQRKISVTESSVWR